jgi:hypothetical protein
MKKVWLFLFSTLLLLTACFNRRPSAAELQEKIDSVKALEVKRQLRMKGVNIDDDGVSPFRLFYDSLHLQVLPISYSEDYVTSLPDFRTVPPSLVVYLDLEGKGSPKAIALPETLNSRLVLLAADQEDGEYELWLYSLDDDYIPVDKLLIYEPSRYSSKAMKKDNRDVYFSITSYMEINVMEYIDDDDYEGQLSTYVVDDSRLFVELPH